MISKFNVLWLQGCLGHLFMSLLGLSQSEGSIIEEQINKEEQIREFKEDLKRYSIEFRKEVEKGG